MDTMSAYTEIICPCTMRQARYKKYSPDTLMPPSRSYSPPLSLGTSISAHWAKGDNININHNVNWGD
jgi:hypothetical protein